MGYHTREIPKGEYGQISKLVEELEEVKDAHEQGSKIMVLVELSDLLGAMQGYLNENIPGFVIEDLLIMAKATKRAFKAGERK